MSGRFTEGNKVIDKGKARHASKRLRGDAGAPVSTPRSPRPRRFRRHALCSHPLHRGALETATAAAPAAPDVAIETDGGNATVCPDTSPTSPTCRDYTAAAPSLPMRAPMRRVLLAFRSETASKGTRASAVRRGDIVAAASISPKLMRSVARCRIGSRDGIFRWVIDRMRRGTHDRAGELAEPKLCDGRQLLSS